MTLIRNPDGTFSYEFGNLAYIDQYGHKVDLMSYAPDWGKVFNQNYLGQATEFEELALMRFWQMIGFRGLAMSYTTTDLEAIKASTQFCFDNATDYSPVRHLHGINYLQFLKGAKEHVILGLPGWNSMPYHADVLVVLQDVANRQVAFTIYGGYITNFQVPNNLNAALNIAQTKPNPASEIGGYTRPITSRPNRNERRATNQRPQRDSRGR